MSRTLRLAPFVSLLDVAAAYSGTPSGGAPGGSGAEVPMAEKHPIDTRPPKPSAETVALAFEGGTAHAYANRPAAAPKGAVLIMHEWWGLNDWIRHEADEMAGLGYLALAPDLYDGKVAKSPDEAGQLMGALDQARADKIEAAAVAWLSRSAPGAKIATIGWCMGGSQSLLASLSNAGRVAATVIYYGAPVDTVSKLKELKGPMLGIYAEKDGWITPDKVDAFDKALTEAGVKHDFYRFDADHAFANPTGGRYKGEAAREAWALTIAFLSANL